MNSDGGIEGEAVPLDGLSRGQQVPAGQGPLLHCYKSKKVMAFLKEQEFSVMDWRGNSPDLNLIENI